MSPKLSQPFLPVFVLLLAFALRIVAIDEIPPGLSHDEAYNGVTAIQVLQGQRLIFFEINKGIEPLIIYLEALAFYLFGIGPVQLRLVNIFCGLLTVALIQPLAVRLFNRRVALLAMTGLAISFWPIFVSRLTLRAVTFPPLLILTIYFLWRALNSISNDQLAINNLHPKSQLPHPTSHIPYLFFILSGLAAGAAMYTYLSNRFVLLLVASIFGAQLVRGGLKREHWGGLILHVIIWAGLFAPLANYYAQNADSFTERYNQVSTIPYALNGEFGPIIENTLQTLGMFTFQGDTTDRYNLDGRPVFDWVNGSLFYLGLGLVLLRLPRSPGLTGPATVLLLWFFSMLLPDFITDDSPHFLRTIGAMPAVYLLWAVGLDRVAQHLEHRSAATSSRSAATSSRSAATSSRSAVVSSTAEKPRNQTALAITAHISRFTPVLILILLTLTTLHTGYDYFNRWATAPGARSIYGADIAEIADDFKTSPPAGLAAISAEFYRDLDPFRWALHFQGNPPFVIWFDGRQTLAFPPPESGLAPAYIFAASAPPAETWLTYLEAAPAESGRAYQVYHLPADSVGPQSPLDLLSTEKGSLGLNVNNDLILNGYHVLGSIASGGKFQVLLSWQALRRLPPDTDYTFLVRLRDDQEQLWTRADGNGYSPADWQPGVQALQLLTLRLPGDLPAHVYHLTLEVVDRHSGQALPTGSGETIIPLATLLLDNP
jgi:predicted membrane-bound mannosyltransferase